MTVPPQQNIQIKEGKNKNILLLSQFKITSAYKEPRHLATLIVSQTHLAISAILVFQCDMSTFFFVSALLRD